MWYSSNPNSIPTDRVFKKWIEEKKYRFVKVQVSIYKKSSRLQGHVRI